jgi:hypothetical protein
LDKICTENYVKIIQIHQNMHLKLLLEINKKKFFFFFHFQPNAAQNALKPARPNHGPRPIRPSPAARRLAPRAQAATWA